MAEGGLALTAVALLGFLWPRLLAWPLAAFGLWMGLALLSRSARQKPVSPSAQPPGPALVHPVAHDEGKAPGTIDDAERPAWR